MRKQRKPVLFPIALILALLLAALALWRFLPRKLSSLLPEKVQSVTACATTHDALPSAALRQYEMQNLPASSAEGRTVLDALAQMRVRPGLRNLLPWPPGSYSESGAIETASVFLRSGEEGESFACTLGFYSTGTVTLQKPGRTGIWVYHITEKALTEQFITWITENGTQLQ